MSKYMAIMTIALLFFLVSAVSAGDGWETTIKVSVLTAENKLVIGQKADASDAIDGRYDVPALLAGDIQAYTGLEGDKYWKDIRQTCNAACKKIWDIVIESDLEGEVVKLSWNSPAIPNGTGVVMKDTETGEIIDMCSGQQEYGYENKGSRKFTLEVSTW